MKKAIVALSICAVTLIMASCTLSNEKKAEKRLKRRLKLISIIQILMSHYRQESIVCSLMQPLSSQLWKSVMKSAI